MARFGSYWFLCFILFLSSLLIAFSMPLEAGEFKHKNFETELPAGWFPKAHDQAEGLNVVFASPTGGGAVSFGFSVVEDNMDSRFLAERMAAQPSLKAKAWPLEGADGIYAVEYKLHNTNRVVMVAFILGQRGLIFSKWAMSPNMAGKSAYFGII